MRLARFAAAVVLPTVTLLGLTTLAAAPAGAATPLPQTAVGTTAAGRSTAIVAPLLRQGDRGQAVRVWQESLDRLDRAAGRGGSAAGSVVVDGIFGPATAHATRVFQRGAHLQVDGVVGPRTRAAMDAALAATTT